MKRQTVWPAPEGFCYPPSGRTGQAAWEALLVTLVLVAGFWGVGWASGGDGVIALLLDAMRAWHHRYATVLALPV